MFSAISAVLVMARPESAAVSLLLLVLISFLHTAHAQVDTYGPLPDYLFSPPEQPGPVTAPPNPAVTGVAPPPPVNTVNAPERWTGNYPATDFRAETVKERFLLWPENLPYARFVYVCQQTSVRTKRNLTDFIYWESQGRLQTRPYFDLGWVDQHYAPFFRHWRMNWRVDIHRLVCPVVCEYTDIQRLYEYRLHRKVMLNGFACGVVALAILQLGVLLSIALLWAANANSIRRTADDRSTPLPQFLWKWCNNLKNWPDFCPDWVHLVLLTTVGFAMVEAAGHSNFFEWRSMLFYNFGVAYTYLTLLAMLSSALFQCAQFSSRTSAPAPAPAPSMSLSRKASTKKLGPLLEDPEDSVSVQKEFWDSDDWKYQRIFGQIGVLILMSMYLLLVDDYEGKSMDSLASVIVGAIVVACIWSFAVATVVALRSLRRLGKGLFNTKFACKSKPSVAGV